MTPLEPLAPLASGSSSSLGSKPASEGTGPASSGELIDDFGDFSSGPPPLVSDCTSAPPLVTNEPQKWADFSQLGTQPAPTTATAAGPLASGSGTNITVPSSSAFDDLLPKELASVKRNKTSKDGSSVSKLTPEGTPSMPRQFKGHEMLEEEMLNRFSDPLRPTTVPSHSPQTLVPEPAAAGSSTSSLDHFGDFESFSGAAKSKGDDLESNSGSLTSFSGKSKVRILHVLEVCMTLYKGACTNLIITVSLLKRLFIS